MDGGTGVKKRKSDALGDGLVPRVALKRSVGASDTTRNALAISNDETKEARVVLLPSSVGDVEGVTVDLLPATVWGHVMDYLSFTDVLSCLGVSRLLSFEAPKYVQYLCIFKPQELQVSLLFRYRRRFENVQHVDICCLLLDLVIQNGATKDNSITPDYFCRFSTYASERIVPFLESFPKLESAFVGGYDFNLCWYETYKLEYCSNPTDCPYLPLPSEFLFRQMVVKFVEAFKAGRLPKNLWLEGVIDHYHTFEYQCICRDFGLTGMTCEFCKGIIREFPLSMVNKMFSGTRHVCLDAHSIHEILDTRKITPECIKYSAGDLAYNLLAAEKQTLPATEKSKDLEKRLEGKGAKETRNIYFVPSEQLDRIEFLCRIGCKIPSERIVEDIKEGNFWQGYLAGYPFAKTSYDRLVAAGYPFEEKDFILVNDEEEPALEGLDFKQFSFPPDNSGDGDGDGDGDDV